MEALFIDRYTNQTIYVTETVVSNNGIKYELQERLSSGGSAVVYKCIKKLTGEEFAIKFLLALGFRLRKRFLKEIKLLKKVNHEQIIRYVDEGTVSSDRNYLNRNIRISFLVMPCAETNLMDYCKRREGNISYEEYYPQFKGLASALSVMHERAIHRDIKPENILIMGDTWFISDIGLCKYNTDSQDITGSQKKIGPVYWMSPEAINKLMGNDDEITNKSDIFQLASIFWFVVNGRHPLGIVQKEDWKGPDKIFEPIYKSLSHDPKRRINNAAELLDPTFRTLKVYIFY